MNVSRRLSLALVGAAAAVAGVAVAGLPSDAPAVKVTEPATVPTTAPATVAPTTTAPATTTTAEATTTTEAPLVDRGALSVVVANAGDSGGLAARGADALAALGYVFVVTADAAGTRETSAVLYAAGFQREAARLAADLGLPADAVAPFDDPSAITGPAGADLVVLLATELAA